MNSAMVGIVAFNPELSLLRSCIRSATAQTSLVCVVDNGSRNADEVRQICQEYGAVYSGSSLNTGVASGLNRVMMIAASRSCEAVLFLDQDSILADGSLPMLLQTLSEDAVGIAVAAVHERNSGAIQTTKAEVDYCITSGSLVRVSTWSEIGQYDEGMFVDFVDFDFCARLRKKGLRIVRDDRASIDHSIGDYERRRLGTIYNYSPFRLRHMAADMTYFAWKHRATPKNLRPPRTSRIGVRAVLARKAMMIAIYETNKVAKVSAILRGAVAARSRPRQQRPSNRAAGGMNVV